MMWYACKVVRFSATMGVTMQTRLHTLHRHTLILNLSLLPANQQYDNNKWVAIEVLFIDHRPYLCVLYNVRGNLYRDNQTH